jgi:dihydroxy-acid dehydratase
MGTENFQNVTIQEEYNPYRECIQGIANEPICVRYTVTKAWEVVRSIDASFDPGEVTLDEIVHRLVINRPRIAVITGSTDHPAHLRDEAHISLAVLRIWQNGGVPFVFGIPVICDGTAQNNVGMCYSLVSRNNTASAVNITFEGHSYHAAYVLSSCDKFPSAVICGLAATDVARNHKDRGQAPVWAIFVPEHVLKGGNIPKNTRARLNLLMAKAREQGHADLAGDIAENMRYILQCSSDEAFSGQLKRAVLLGLITADESRTLLNELAAATCDVKGGVCAFNGTGNSSRTLVSALGLTPPDVELLTDAPTSELVAECVDMLYRSLNRKELRITNVVGRNFENTVRIHSATGSSTNILLHLPAIMRYAGYDISINDYEQVRKATPVPEIFAHSLTEGRDTFVLAEQFAKRQHRGMESLYRILTDLGVTMDLDAPTMTGTTWQERIKGLTVPVAAELGERAIIRTVPTRMTSGVEVLRGNFMSTAVVKLAGMSDQQLAHFDHQLFIVRYYEDEHLCIKEMASPNVVEVLEQLVAKLPSNQLDKILKYNSKGSVRSFSKDSFLELVSKGVLAFAFMIAGQGPKAFGMPEMFAPSQNLRHHKLLEGSSLLITDGRYSGVTKGACIGHVTPEAFDGGGIGTLADGDLLWLRIDEQRLDVVDPDSLATGTPVPFTVLPNREKLVDERHQKMDDRLWQIAASNLMDDVSSAEKGCVPYAVDQRAIKKLP